MDELMYGFIPRDGIVWVTDALTNTVMGIIRRTEEGVFLFYRWSSKADEKEVLRAFNSLK